jgi:DNA-binding NarL/FixJ family response regulator
MTRTSPALAPAREPLRVLLVEDSVLLREGLVRLFDEAGYVTVGAFGDAVGLVDRIRATRPAVVVLDVRLPPTFRDEGIRAALEIRRDVPEVAVLVLSQYVETVYARELLADARGGVGYLLKDRVSSFAEFTEALRRVVAGGTVLDPLVVGRLVAAARHPLAALTPREREVLGLIAEGRSNTSIAERLTVGTGAVEKHVSGIFAKLGLAESPSDHRRVLAVLALLQGDCPPPEALRPERDSVVVVAVPEPEISGVPRYIVGRVHTDTFGFLLDRVQRKRIGARVRVRACGGHARPMVPSAQHLVADGTITGRVPHLDLIAVGDHRAADRPGVVRRRTSAPAQRPHLQLLHPVAQLDESRGPREQPGPEVGENAEAERVDAQLVHDARELVDLLGRIELGLVADEVVDTMTRDQLVDHVCPEVEGGRNLDGRPGQPDAGHDSRLATAVQAGEDPSGPSGLGLRVVDLQRESRLAALHGAGEEGELGHGPIQPQTGALRHFELSRR